MKKYFLDCGTHFGEGLTFFTKYLSMDDTWKVCSFEANPTTYDYFIKKHKHDFDYLNCSFMNMAIADYDGSVVFNRETPKSHSNEYKMGGASSMMPISEWNPFGTFKEDYNDSVVVKCMDLSAYVEAITNYSKIYIKLDIEGAEFQVLEKMIKDKTIEKIDTLWIEFHDSFFKDKLFYLNRKNNIISYLQNKKINIYEWH
jgi:FkbM family methyltransferase